MVSATSGGTRDAISGSFSTGEDGNALIYTTVQNTNYSGITNIDALSNVNAIIFENTSGTVYGSLTLTEALTIPEGSSLIIPEGASLTIPEGVTITMNGNLTVDGTLTIATGVVSMGEGTSDSPYLIPNAATLQDYRDKINNDNTSYGDKHYRLTADIDLNPGYTFDENGDYRTDEGAGTLVTWTPMGNDTNPFSGTFEGNGKTISGLYFNDTSVNCVGLFGYSKGTIQNIGIEDSYFSGSYHVGGICGWNDSGSIINCSNTGTISGINRVGGVCGTVGGNNNTVAIISNCSNRGIVNDIADKTTYNIGGVCGIINDNATIINCFNSGKVNTQNCTYVGGVCGFFSQKTLMPPSPTAITPAVFLEQMMSVACADIVMARSQTATSSNPTA